MAPHCLLGRLGGFVSVAVRQIFPKSSCLNPLFYYAYRVSASGTGARSSGGGLSVLFHVWSLSWEASRAGAGLIAGSHVIPKLVPSHVWHLGWDDLKARTNMASPCGLASSRRDWQTSDPGCLGLQGQVVQQSKAKLHHLLCATPGSHFHHTDRTVLVKAVLALQIQEEGREHRCLSQWEGGKVTLKKSLWDGRCCCGHLWKVRSATSYPL